MDAAAIGSRSSDATTITVRVFSGSRRHTRFDCDWSSDVCSSDLLPERRFDLILCIQYLQRSLFSQMARALRPDGVLLFETYTRAQLEFAGGPRDPAYLLETGELREAFPELCVQFYRELRAGRESPEIGRAHV